MPPYVPRTLIGILAASVRTTKVETTLLLGLRRDWQRRRVRLLGVWQLHQGLPALVLNESWPFWVRTT